MTQPHSIVIPGYQIGRKLGQGGMATVYLAIQESFEREVALKLMSPFLNSDPSFTTRFVREARIVAQIHHASIVPVMDVGEYQTHHYLSMEFLPGGDLKHRIAAGKHGLPLAVSVCLAISAALDVAHRKGFVHRDIKPENILFREDDTPVLTDFGIARAIDAGTSLTMAGMMVGTPSYMSPEQVKGHELDGRSDLYSLGIVFYETLTGNVPFRADSTMSLALKHLSDPLPPLPPEFALYQPFIDRLTAKEREDRFASGAEVARALRLINEMAHPRAHSMLRHSVTHAFDSTLSPTLGLSMPAATDGYDSTLLAPRHPSANTVAIPQTAASETATPAAATTPKAAPAPRVPRPPSKLALTLRAAGPALRSSLQHTAKRLSAATARGWRKLTRPSQPPLQRPAASGAAAALVPEPRATFGAALRSFTTDPRKSRHLSWAALGIAALAFGSYLFSRQEAPAPQAGIEQPTAPAIVAAAPLAMAMVAPEQPSDEVLALLQRLAAQREALTTVPALFERARVREERLAVKLRREEERKRKLEEEETRRAEALQRAEELRLANEQRIQELLGLAKSDVSEGHIYLPAGTSAADRYLEVLKINASQPEALTAIKRIGELLVAESDRYLKVGQTAEAGTLVTRLRSIQPQNAGLASLETRLQATPPVALTRRDQDRLVKTARTIGKANETLDRKNLNYRDMDTASDAYQDAARLLPESPGLETLRERIVVSFAAATKAQLADNDVKEAKRIVEMAKKRNMVSQDLEQFESLINESARR